MAQLSVEELAGFSAGQLRYMRVAIDKEAWDDHHLVLAAQKVPRWKPPESYIFQFNGETYEVKLGETVMLPSVVAAHGIKQSRCQPRAISDTGERLLVEDRNGDMIPCLVQVGPEISPDDIMSPAPVVPPAPKRICPFCDQEVDSGDDLAEHLASEHAEKLNMALERATEPEAVAV